MRDDDGPTTGAQQSLKAEAHAEPTAGTSSEIVAPCSAPPAQSVGVVIVAQLVDATELAPAHQLRHALEMPPAQVPRRFGVGVLLLFLTAFSLLFYALKWVQAPPWLVLLFCLLFVLVAVAQMLSRGQPRKVSMMAGAIYGLLLSLLLLATALSATRPPQGAVILALLSVFLLVPVGVILGYLAGTLLAGMFLTLGWRSEEQSPGPQRSSS